MPGRPTRWPRRSYCLIAGESDGLPGVTIDRFGNFFRCCSCSAQARRIPAPPSSAPRRTCSRTAPFTIAARCRRRAKEGLELAQGPVVANRPRRWLPDLPSTAVDEAANSRYPGRAQDRYYLDPQRDQPPRHPPYVADKRVLNCFSSHRRFAVSALDGGCRQSHSAWNTLRRRSDRCPPERGDQRTGSVQSGVCARRRVQTAAQIPRSERNLDVERGWIRRSSWKIKAS